MLYFLQELHSLGNAKPLNNSFREESADNTNGLLNEKLVIPSNSNLPTFHS